MRRPSLRRAPVTPGGRIPRPSRFVVCAVTAAATALVTPATASAAAPADAGSTAGAAIRAGNALGSTFGSAGPAADPLAQTLGSANGSSGNPGPVADPALRGDCTPTAAHPRPVLLLHGTYGDAPQLDQTLGATLRARGYCTYAPTYGAYAALPNRGGLAPISTVSGPQVAAAIDTVLARTGATHVDMVGFSQGAAVAGYVAKVLRPAAVAHVVSVGGYWGGDVAGMIPGGLDTVQASSLLGVANLGALAEVLPGTPTHARWYGSANTPFAPGIDYTLVGSRYDEVMPPDRSFPSEAVIAAGRASGARVETVVVQDGCPSDRLGHSGIPSDARVADLVDSALDPARTAAPVCPAAG